MGQPDQHEVTVRIVNELGMHARAATKFVQLSSSFECDVAVEKDGQSVNGKSIMGVLMLVAAKGTSIRIVATGSKARECATQLAKLVEEKFGEER